MVEDEPISPVEETTEQDQPHNYLLYSGQNLSRCCFNTGHSTGSGFQKASEPLKHGGLLGAEDRQFRTPSSVARLSGPTLTRGFASPSHDGFALIGWGLSAIRTDLLGDFTPGHTGGQM